MVLEQPRVRPLVQAEIMLRFRKEMRVPGKADQVGKVQGRVRLHLQKIAAAHQFGHRTGAELRHNLPQLFRDKEHEPLHILRLAGEAPAQLRILGRDTERAGAQVAHAHHATAHRDQRRRGKAEFLRTEQQRHRHVMAGHQLAVRFQRHLLAQPVAAQHLMRFRQADFPGQARVVHAAERNRAGTALPARNQDPARSGLGHAAGNGANTGGGDQLHGNLRLLVGALQVVNQLRQILNRIDVMVRRRGNQRDTRHGAAGPRHALRDLGPGQVPAFARLGALGHLDLDFLRGKQVFPGHAETA